MKPFIESCPHLSVDARGGRSVVTPKTAAEEKFWLGNIHKMFPSAPPPPSLPPPPPPPPICLRSPQFASKSAFIEPKRLLRRLKMFWTALRGVEATPSLGNVQTRVMAGTCPELITLGAIRTFVGFADIFAVALKANTTKKVTFVWPCTVAGHIPTLPWVRFRVWVRVEGLGVATREGWVGMWPATRLDPIRTFSVWRLSSWKRVFKSLQLYFSTVPTPCRMEPAPEADALPLRHECDCER